MTEKMDQFLKKYKLSQFTQYEINTWTSPVTIKEFEFIIYKLPEKQSVGPEGFMAEF